MIDVIRSPVRYQERELHCLLKIVAKRTILNFCNNMLLNETVKTKPSYLLFALRVQKIFAFRVTQHFDLKLKLDAQKNVCKNIATPIISQNPYIYFTRTQFLATLAIYTSDSKLLPLLVKKEWPIFPIFRTRPLLVTSTNQSLLQQPTLSSDMSWNNSRNLLFASLTPQGILPLDFVMLPLMRDSELSCFWSLRTWFTLPEPMTSWSISREGSQWKWSSATKVHSTWIFTDMTRRESDPLPATKCASHRPQGGKDALRLHLLNHPLNHTTTLRESCNLMIGDPRDAKQEKSTTFFLF